MISDSYAAAVRDETWIGGVLVDSCLSCGEAQQRGDEITASDRLSDPALLDACNAEAARVRTLVRALDAPRVRIMVRATSDEAVFTTMVVTIGGVSIVTTPEHALEDAKKLSVAPRSSAAAFGLPLLWRNGTAAILMHEAIGHATEHGHAPLHWPAWLDVKIGFAGRRESFRDVPLRRMTEVIVAQKDAPFSLPDRCINIDYVSGGSYEPLTQTVTIDVAVPRFTIRATRSQIASSILGATGDPIRYPGVICSREGQELFVASHAPVMLTAGLT